MTDKEETLAHYQDMLKELQEDWITTPVGRICLIAFREQEEQE